ncbi:CRISPR-associated helicase Cas3' [Fusobacterium sp.]|uniref:CRISPR-associated helicase Cas3' n=1 Tax=Fusobacterium sp. TaxID=68766 RepID=UPI00396C5A96
MQFKDKLFITSDKEQILLNNKIKLFPIDKFVNNLDKYLAHIREDRNEKLKEHLILVIKYFIQICNEKNLFPILKNFWSGSEDFFDFWIEMLVNTIYMHDIGKLNIVFQKEKMSNHILNIDFDMQDSRHSLFSSLVYICYFCTRLGSIFKKLSRKELETMVIFIFLNGYIISRHHTSLENFQSYITEIIEKEDVFEKIMNYCPDLNMNKFKNKTVKKILNYFSEKRLLVLYGENWESIDLYIYSRLVYGLLVSADFYATYEFMTGNKIDKLDVIDNIEEFSKKFETHPIIEGIRKHDSGEYKFDEKNINKYRSEIFIEAQKKICDDSKESIFYLEAPTGSGKTITSINLALSLLKKDKNLNNIFYIFPFNTLVEQTANSLYQFFDREQIGIINSITPMDLVMKSSKDSGKYLGKIDNTKSEENYSDVDYEATLMKRQFIHYPLVVTTHVHFFRDLFGLERDANFALPHLANSIVIMDEIQSYKSDIWKEIIIFLKKYADILNIKIIIMSATLPNIGKLLDVPYRIPSLVEREKYFNNPIFSERVFPDFSLLNKKPKNDKEREIIFEILAEKVVSEYRNNKKIIIEFILKKSANEFFKKLLEEFEIEKSDVFLMTGDDNKVERERIINITKEKKRTQMILVATQVVEAGVDIDMDVGFKNISLFDSEEQFLGRINRSCRKQQAKAYFFYYDNPKLIYKGEVRAKEKNSLIELEMQKKLLSKSFNKYYERILSDLNEESYRYNENNIDDFKNNAVKLLDYRKIKERMELIKEDQDTAVLYLSTKINYRKKEYDGFEVWEQLKQLIENSKLDYAEKKVKMAEIMEIVSLFSYNLPKIYFYGLSYNDSIGDTIFRIDDYEKYFINGKFDRNRLKKQDEDGFEFIV